MGSSTSSHSSASRSSHGHHRRHHKSAGKVLLFLHSFNLVFSLLSIGIFTAIIPIWNANFIHTSGLLRGDWPDGLPILPLSITLLTSAYYLVRLIHARRTSTKPDDYFKTRHTSHETPIATKKSFFLIVTTLILLLTFLILAAISGVYRFWRPAVITSSVELSSGTASTSTTLSTLSLRHIFRSISDTTPTSPGLTPPKANPSAQNSKPTFHSCTLANIFTRRCNPTLYLLGDLQITAISSAALVWLLNLIIFVLQIRDRQYQKRRQQRSLRAKARSKLDLIEDEMSRAEKGTSPAPKKIHHERRKRHGKSSSDSSLPSTKESLVTRPARALTQPNIKIETDQNLIRPKQHYYNPNISPSRSKGTREPVNFSDTTINHAEQASMKPATTQMRQISTTTPQERGRSAYSKAVEETRRKVKPAETMRDWLAGRS